MDKNYNIPTSLKKQIVEYRQSLFRNETLLTIGAGISALLISFFLLFISDRFWDTPKIIRLICLVAGIFSLVYFFYRLIKHWLKAREIKDLASRIQKRHRELGDRLLGAIELAQGVHQDENISEELKEAAIKRVTQQASQIDFKKDVEHKKPLQAVMVMLILTAISTVLFFMLPQVTRNALFRWFKPIASISRFTFIVLEERDKVQYVAKGEADEIPFKLSPASKWWPKKLFYSIPGITSGSTDFTDDEARVKIDGLNEPVQLTVQAGDATQSLTLDPVHRPALIALNSTIVYPEYTGREKTNSQLENGVLKLLSGSKYVLEGTVSRNLTAATQISGQSVNKLKISGAKFATSERIAKKNVNTSFSWKDVLDFEPAAPYDFLLKVEKDREPFTECPGLSRFSAILIDEALKITIKSDDDFGIRNIGAEYFYKPDKEQKISKKLALAEGNKNAATMNAEFLFSPELLDLPEKSLVTFRPFAQDFFPGRKPVYSAPYQFYILSHEQHMKLVQERLERIMSDLEDMVRREENSLELNKKISKMPDNKIKKNTTTEKIREQQLREQAEKREAKKMTSEAVKLLKEALRNKKFPEKIIAEWSEFLDQMNKISQQEMSDMVKDLQQAVKNDQQQDERKKNMSEAVKNQEKMLDKMKKILEKMDSSLKSLVLENFVNRLKKEAEREQKISNAFKEMLKDIIGMPAESIKGPIKEKFKEQITLQKSIKRNAGNIYDDLMAFFARTRLEKYQEVTEDMDKFKLHEVLQQQQQFISQNYTSKTIALSGQLADKFNAWAKMLSDADDSQADQDSQQGEQIEVSPEFILGLMRIIQGEQTLRDKTRYLEKNKPEKAQDYKLQCYDLSGDQGDLHVKLLFLQNEVRNSQAAMQLLGQAGKAMDDVVAFLRKPQTDGAVIAAETEIIELLSGALQQTGKQSAKANSMMAMLMQMLMQQGSGAGNTPGQSNMGGTTDAQNLKFNDPEFQKNQGEREGEKTQGISHKELPEEYKSAIEAYFKKRSKIKEQ